MKNYLTIRQSGKLSQTIKKSEFICSIARCNAEDSALKFIEQIRKQNPKARHNCFAYLIGINDEIQRVSDNGEPSGTAGIPILNALKHNQIHNVVTVVTRYFGGIKLGTGGLIRAYNGVTANTIKKIGIVQRVIMNEIQFELDYSLFEKVKFYLRQHSIQLLNSQYTSKVIISVIIEHSQIKAFKTDLQNYLSRQLVFKMGNEVYCDQPFNGQITS